MRLDINRRIAALLIGAIVMAAAVAGCGDDNKTDARNVQDPKHAQEEKENFSSEPPPIQVHTGYSSGYHVKKPTAVIVRNDAQLKDIKAKQFDNGVEKEEIAPVTFDGEKQVVAVFLPKSDPGVGVTIIDVFPKDGLVHIKAVRLLPGKGCPTAKERPYPFHWVQTREMDGNADLELVTQRSPAC